MKKSSERGRGLYSPPVKMEKGRMVHSRAGRRVRRGAGITLLLALNVTAAPRGVENSPPPPASAEAVTFFVLADTHFGVVAGEAHRKLLNAMRVVAGEGGSPVCWPSAGPRNLTAPAAAGRPIGAPRGLVILGDLCHWGGGFSLFGDGDQLSGFKRVWIDNPNQPWPVYIGLGNHDVDPEAPGLFRRWYRRQMWGLVERRHRGPRAPVPVEVFDDASRSYAWSWGSVRMIQMHLCAADVRNERADNLPWVRGQLDAAARAGQTVVMLQHFGFDRWSARDWWSDAQREALVTALAGHPVAAFFHGHIHAFRAYRWKGIPVVAVNNSEDEIDSGNHDGPGSFLIVRIGDGRMDVLDCRGLDRRGQPVWGGADSFPLPAPARERGAAEMKGT